MIDRDHLERILKLNGLAPTAADEEIKSVLLSARYKEHEVDTAIMVLRENKLTNKTKVDGLHKVFRSDSTLNAAEISALLGIDVELTDRVEPVKRRSEPTAGQHAFLLTLSLLLAFTMLFGYMYFKKVGLFHHTSAFVYSSVE